jgi:GTPase SAR1 family protein
MGKLFKILICGKRSIGKTVFIEQLIYSHPLKDKYFPTIEDIYTSYWEKDKMIKEKFRFYDTKGMENHNDQQTVESLRHLFTQIDACILMYSSCDMDSFQCCEKLKNEIDKEKIREKSKDNINFIAIDIDANQLLQSQSRADEQQRLQLKNVPTYDILMDRREQINKAFNDLASNLTQISNSSGKSAMNLVSSIKKPKVFSSK